MPDKYKNKLYIFPEHRLTNENRNVIFVGTLINPIYKPA